VFINKLPVPGTSSYFTHTPKPVPIGIGTRTQEKYRGRENREYFATFPSELQCVRMHSSVANSVWRSRTSDGIRCANSILFYLTFQIYMKYNQNLKKAKITGA
jgi:hypothetical protein